MTSRPLPKVEDDTLDGLGKPPLDETAEVATDENAHLGQVPPGTQPGTPPPQPGEASEAESDGKDQGDDGDGGEDEEIPTDEVEIPAGEDLGPEPTTQAESPPKR